MSGLWKLRYLVCGLAASGLSGARGRGGRCRAPAVGGFGSRGSKTYQAPPPTQTAPNRGLAHQPLGHAAAGCPAAGRGRCGSSGWPVQPAGLHGRHDGGLPRRWSAWTSDGQRSARRFVGPRRFPRPADPGRAGGRGCAPALELVAAPSAAESAGLCHGGGPSLRDANPQANPYERQPALQPAYGGGSGVPMQGGTDNLELTEADFDAFEKKPDRRSGGLFGRRPEQAARARDAGNRRLFRRGTGRECGPRPRQHRRRHQAPAGRPRGSLERGRHRIRHRRDALRRRWTTPRSAPPAQIVDGDKQPFERTELWTFRRSHGGEWMLSAIQEA